MTDWQNISVCRDAGVSNLSGRYSRPSSSGMEAYGRLFFCEQKEWKHETILYENAWMRQ